MKELKNTKLIFKRFVFFLYLVISLIYLFQLYYFKSFPGKVDNIFFLSSFHDFYNLLISFINGSDVVTSYYPEDFIFPYGSYPWALGIIYAPFIFLDIDPYFSFYILYSLIFSSNAYGLYLLSRSLNFNINFSFFNGLLFVFSNYLIANFDNPDSLVFFPGLVALSFLFRTDRNIIYVFLLLSIQLYFSAYLFLYFSIVIFLFFLFNSKSSISFEKIRDFSMGLILSLILITPFILIYFVNIFGVSYINPSNEIYNQHIIGLKIGDFLNPLQTNLFYSKLSLTEDSNWLFKTKSVFSGFLIFILAAISFFFNDFKFKYFWLTVLFFFFIFSWGPYYPLNYPVKNFLFPIYEKLDIHKIVRIPIRAYSIVLISLIILSSYSISEIYKKNKKMAYIFFLLIFLENFSPKLFTYSSKSFINMTENFDFMKPNDVVLNLPSDLYPIVPLDKNFESCKMDDYEFSIIREYWYMYFQAKCRLNSVNGFTSYLPKSRFNNQNLFNCIDKKDYLKYLIEKNGIKYIIFYKFYKNGCNYELTLNSLIKSDFLFKLVDNDEIIIFSVQNRHLPFGFIRKY